MNIFVKITLAVILVILTHHLCRIGLLMGFHIHLYNHYPGVCHRVEGADFGSEHMFLTPDGLVFITSGLYAETSLPGFKQYVKDNKVKGRILLFNFKNPAKTAPPLKIPSTENFDVDKFAPHGISGLVDSSGVVTLFVVNHGYDEDRIEKFQYVPEKQELKHLKYYSHPAMKIMNDVAAVGSDSFYFTNCQQSRSNLYNTLQALLFLPWLDVGYCAGDSCSIQASGLVSSNGIATSPDRRFVYVADIFLKDLKVYERQANNSLVLLHVHPLYSLVDNIHVDEATGDLYLGSHPIAHQILHHMEHPGPEARSTSQVLQVKLKEGAWVSSQELFLDDGAMISGSSVAVLYKKKMLIGSVMDKMVYCDVAVPL